MLRARNTSLQRDVDGDRDDAQRAGGEHHHRMRGLAAFCGERGEIFGMPWKGEAAAIEHGLADRIGDDGARLSALHETHRLLDRLLHGGGGGSCRAGLARPSPATVIGSTGSSSAKRASAASASAIVAIGTFSPSASARSASTVGSPSSTKGGIGSWRLREPGEQGDVGPDPGGIAQGQRERVFGMCHAASASTKSVVSSDIR